MEKTIEELDKIFADLKIGGCSSPSSHSKIFSEVLNLVKPKEILEIGFFVGGSAGLFLNLSDANLTSVDPIDNNTTTDYLNSIGRADQIQECSVQFAAVDSVFNAYRERFTFVQKRSLQACVDSDLEKNKYQLAFVDGCHTFASVMIDLNICLALNIPFLLLDDASNEYPGVIQAVNQMKNRFGVVKFYQKPDDGANVLFLANLDVVKFEENE